MIPKLFQGINQKIDPDTVVVVGADTTVIGGVGFVGKKISPQPPVTGLIELNVNTIAVKVAMRERFFVIQLFEQCKYATMRRGMVITLLDNS